MTLKIEWLKNFFKKEVVVDVIIFLLLGLLSLSWFRGNNLIGGGDFGMTTDWVKYFKIMFYSWDETFSMGMPVYRQVALLIPYALVGAFFQSLGFSIVFIEKFFFYSWFAGSGLSMYFLCSVLGMKRAGRLVSSIFYMLNPFSLIIIWIVSHGLIQMPYAFAPLVLGLYIYGLRKKKGLNYIIIANIIWLFSTGSANANPRITIIHWLPIAFYFAGSYIFDKEERKFILKYTLKFLGLWIVFNFYWLFIFIRTINESIVSAHSPFLLPDEAELKLTSVKFFEAIRMLGYWSLKSGYKGDPYYPYWNFFNSFWVNLISWLIPLFVTLGLFNKETKKQPLRFFFIVMLVVGLIGINGANPPIGNTIVWFYKLFPPLMLLARFNFLFFGIPTYLVFCLLFGYGFLLLYEFIIKKLNKKFAEAALFFLVVLLNVFLVFPFWSGEVIRVPGKLFPGERYQIPSYWFEVKKWLSDQKDFFRVFPLPMSTTYNAAMRWGEGYAGGDLTRWFMPQPVINANTGDTYKVPEIIGKCIEQETDFKNISNLLGFLNVKYLLVRNDIRWEFLKGHDWWYSHNPQNIEKFIKKQEGLSLEKKFGELEVYRLSDEFILPKIYIPTKMTVINGGVEEVEAISQFLHPETRDCFFLTEQNSQFSSSSFGILADFISKAPTDQPQGQDVRQIVYNVEVKDGRKFRILFKNDGILDFYQPGGDYKIIIDQGDPLERKIETLDNNLLSLGEIQLAAGSHKISFLLPPPVNLVANPSFEEKQDQFQYSTDAVEGKSSLDLSARQGVNIVSIPIANFRPGASYNISLSSKNISGEQPFILLWENLDGSLNPSFNPQLTQFGYVDLKTAFSRINLPVGNSWQNFTFSFKPNLFSKSVGIALVSSFNGITMTENLFDKLEVYRSFDRSLVLQRVDFNQSLPGKAPDIEFKKINPTKYRVEIKNATTPFFLIFSEAFHPKWEISTGGKHFMVNGFANGWYIEKLGDYKFTIYFEPQRIYYFSIGVSLTALLLSIGYLWYQKIKNSKS